MTNLHWVAGVALTLTLAASACSSDDATSSPGAGEAGAAGASESNGGGSGSSGAAGVSGDVGGALDVAEGGAAGSLIGAGGALVVPVACLPAGDIAVSATGFTYVIATVKDPGLTLCRGNTYTFVLDASVGTPIAHPFYIKTTNTSTAVGAFTSGVTGNGNTSGSVVFKVPADAPDTLYYHCAAHAPMGGTLTIVN